MSNYAFMTKEKYNEIADSLVHGVRFSVDDEQAVAKLADGQEPEGTTIRNHEEALIIVQSPPWVPEE
tara:strand:+ start:6694 stop:6894 length:201 start_codon:yes stop_codon:yes gene_type:complete